ncbi:MAG: hypothetical protein SWX82_23790 [Cyanobacteriota bacterium]|nr:hypothetical protein [Cyanobacteriota bacterium]
MLRKMWVISVISYQLSVISYQLSVISYQLSVISYQYLRLKPDQTKIRSLKFFHPPFRGRL